jgi:PAS domain-containing protein
MAAFQQVWLRLEESIKRVLAVLTARWSAMAQLLRIPLKPRALSHPVSGGNGGETGNPTIAYAVHSMPDDSRGAVREEIGDRETLFRQLQEQQEALRLRNAQFEALLQHIPQALCFFDKSHRLIACNTHYIEMCGFQPGDVFPGIALRKLIDLRQQAGTLPAGMSAEQFLARRRAIVAQNRAYETVDELANGRIWQIHYRPMPDGGWVATHDDVTEQLRLHTELKDQYEIVTAQQEQLHLRNRQFDLAVNHMTQGLCFFGADQRLLVCN